MRNIVAIIINYLNKQKWYNWCKENSIAAHLIGAAFIGLILSVLYFFMNDCLVIGISFLVITILSCIKEWTDCIKPNPTGWDWMDILYNYLGWICGSVIGYVLFIIIIVIYNISI